MITFWKFYYIQWLKYFANRKTSQNQAIIPKVLRKNIAQHVVLRICVGNDPLFPLPPFLPPNGHYKRCTDIRHVLEKLLHIFSYSSYLFNQKNQTNTRLESKNFQILREKCIPPWLPTTMETLTFHGKVCLPTWGSMTSWTPNMYWKKKIIKDV